MVLEDRWLLPEGVDEALPPQAEHLEALRRRILDLFHSWGYDLVIPPLIEYLESLLTGAGHDLDLQTFKLTDQLTGRLMGVRADMTPQVARIDAHRLRRDAPTRLCYLGPVLHTLPDSFAGSRNPFQIGAELYGHRGLESDVEVMCLMLDTLTAAGFDSVLLDLGHMAIFRGLSRQAALDRDQESTLFDALQRKACPEINRYLNDWSIAPRAAGWMAALPALNGEESILAQAQEVFAGASQSVIEALAELREIARLLAARAPAVELHFDLAELRGYHYHTGVMFAAYVPGQGQALAKGGRYDDIGRIFGRARPATGFSTDLKLLVGSGAAAGGAQDAVFAPWSEDVRLAAAVAELRRGGRRVVYALPGQAGGAPEVGCNKMLNCINGQWQVTDVPQE
ncbi:MAG: ATP phosphoribosyltransferase regulatory subunit [Pseudomonadota bacterium]|nr:ATP phosphoribosyltransferase regulatory subunit [Pseudomonadota bacterium]